MKPRLLDAFAGRVGGSAVGYHRAGFDVWGVDLVADKNYPYTLVRGNALQLLADKEFLSMFDVIHASPPCQENSRTKHLRDAQGGAVKENGSDVIAEVRSLLAATGKPYVVENVEGAPIRDDLTLCGKHFGLHVMRGDVRRPLKRHRVFESNVPLDRLPLCEHPRTERPLGVYGTPADDIPAGGQTARTIKEAGQLMGIDWATSWAGIKEAIPPVYATYVGFELMKKLRLAA